MMIVEFKNGNKIKVEDEIVGILAGLIQQGTKQWQCFSRSSETKDTYLVLNMTEIASIYSHENIL